MRAVNLLPRDEQKAKVEGGRAPLLVLAGGIAAVTAAAVMLGLSASGIADEQKSQLSLVGLWVAPTDIQESKFLHSPGERTNTLQLLGRRHRSISIN